eukprot:CAMPEP_0194533426 /NCGR_PEP_ID=MMETSP0253-20130528/71310_1 /TAXON_ID=2966 /ORGANISM="Noctiluca scintillans" /LENGTH=40 /DNA_ID= /DNA_START= /DNA_END= /DNA_ORIENTATION=
MTTNSNTFRQQRRRREFPARHALVWRLDEENHVCEDEGNG